MKISKEGAEALVQAIIVSACDDYRVAAKHLSVAKDEYAKKQALGKIDSLTRFFKSNYCSIISPLDPMIIIEKLNKDIFEEFGVRI